MKQCTLCKGLFPLTSFNRKSRAPDGLQNVCRECNRANARRYFAENREKHIRVIMERTRLARQLAQDHIGSYLSSHPCVDCGEQDIRVLDFDHRPGVVKISDVMRLVRFGHNLRKIDAEIEKCDVRCRNCHARVTYERAGNSWRQRWFEKQRSVGL
jgi:hypothetical protein